MAKKRENQVSWEINSDAMKRIHSAEEKISDLVSSRYKEDINIYQLLRQIAIKDQRPIVILTDDPDSIFDKMERYATFNISLDASHDIHSVTDMLQKNISVITSNTSVVTQCMQYKILSIIFNDQIEPGLSVAKCNVPKVRLKDVWRYLVSREKDLPFFRKLNNAYVVYFPSSSDIVEFIAQHDLVSIYNVPIYTDFDLLQEVSSMHMDELNDIVNGKSDLNIYRQLEKITMHADKKLPIKRCIILTSLLLYEPDLIITDSVADTAELATELRMFNYNPALHWITNRIMVITDSVTNVEGDVLYIDELIEPYILSKDTTLRTGGERINLSYLEKLYSIRRNYCDIITSYIAARQPWCIFTKYVETAVLLDYPP
jgi:hypothetical protein